MSFTLTFGQEGPCATAQVVWSVDGQTYNFRSDNNFIGWISTIFTVADVVNGGGGDLLISSDQLPPVQGGVGNLWAEYGTASSVVGNSRGVGAVDWQQFRALATQVASGDYATIGGGGYGTASGNYGTIGGGRENTASGNYATVGGGYINDASGSYATAGGGKGNTASSLYATVAGGSNNTVSGEYATIGGGQNNTASVYFATVGGGTGNTASGSYATVGGGATNTASATYATVCGGDNNTASSEYATVGGGQANNASGSYATIGGGGNNTASGGYATIGGGKTNTASGYVATVIGGQNSLADRYGMVAHASGRFSVDGDAQAVEFVARNTTVGVTPAVLFLDGASTRFTVTNNSLLSGILTISGFNTTGTKNAVYQRSVLITNVGGTTTLAHVSTVSTDHETDATWAVTITADNATDSLNISCTGSLLDTVAWVAVFRGLQILLP